MGTKDEILGSQEAAIPRPEEEIRVKGLTLLGRAVPVVGFAAAAGVSWYADSKFLLFLTSLAAAFFASMLGRHFLLWRGECRRLNTDHEPKAAACLMAPQQHTREIPQPGR